MCPASSRWASPPVFFDFPIYLSVSGNYDVVLPESFTSVKNFCLTLIRERGIRSLGFVGDYTHCTSFYERFLAMREALFLAGMEYDTDCSFIEKGLFPLRRPRGTGARSRPHQDPRVLYLRQRYHRRQRHRALKLLRKRVPRDVMVAGFDNLPEAKNCDPALTTFNVDKTGLGRKLLDVLLARIGRPREKSQVIYLQSNSASDDVNTPKEPRDSLGSFAALPSP